tara:strand:- start:3110 stop:3391 length:282 start_codon:yes stop_codon:yes gene_type:complete
MSGAYPSSLSYHVKRFNGVSGNAVKLVPLGSTTVNPDDTMVINLPSSGIVDLNSVKIFARAATTTTSNVATLPNHAESLIESVQIEMGKTIQV